MIIENTKLENAQEGEVLMNSVNQTKPADPAGKWWFKPIGQFLEIFALLVLTSLLGLFWLPTSFWKNFATVAITILGLASLVLAIFCSYKAAEEDENKNTRNQEDVCARRHRISDTRLAVLKDMDVPESVRSFLKTLIFRSQVGTQLLDASGNPALSISGGELLAAMSDEMGPEIVKKFKDIVLEHTLVEENQRPAVPKKDQLPPTTPKPSNGSQPSQLTTETVST